jgi:hypothetical protein
MEDASGEDLDWFWRGWFYGTEVCDLSLDTVKYAKAEVDGAPTETQDAKIKRAVDKPQVPAFDDLSKIRNREDKNIVFETDRDTTLRDFYWRYARGIEPYDTAKYEVTIPGLKPEALTAEEKEKYRNRHMYELTFSNKGGLVMPIILEWTYTDGTTEYEKIPAQVWRLNENKVIKTFVKNKEVKSIKLDPYRETADIDEKNNTWNTMPTPTRFSVFKQSVGGPRRGAPGVGGNPMQRAKEKENEKKAF